MKGTSNRLYTWATEKAASTKAPLWIALLFLLELFLFIPLDAVLMFFCLQNPRKTFLYVFIAALTSTISALAGYLFGHFLWDFIAPYAIPHLISAAFFAKIALHLQLYENWAIFIGTLLPLPLKAISLTSGVFHLALIPYLSAVFTARLLRFALVGISMLLWGTQVKAFLDRHIKKIALLLGAKIALVFAFFFALAK